MRREALALGLALGLTLSGCHYDVQGARPTPSPAPTPAEPSVAVVVEKPFALPVDPAAGWNPYGGSKSSNMTLLGLVCESLFALDGTFTPQPLLASGATALEDGLAWTVRLRDGVTFSDGSALDAKAVAAACNAAKGAKSVYATRLSGVKKITAQADGTVLFQLSEANADFPALLDFPIAKVEGETVVGTGPYTVGEESLTARQDWWRGLALPLDAIALKAISDADGLAAEFSQGEVSLVAVDPTGTESMDYAGNYQSWEYVTSTVVYVGFRCNKGPCKSAEFRSAVSQALDREGLVGSALSGHAVAATLPVAPTAGRYDRTVADKAGYDPLAAGQALEELGYRLGEDGLRYNGRYPLSLTVLVSSDNVYNEALAKGVAEKLGELGIQATVKALPWEDYQKALTKGEFDLYLAQSRMTGDFDPGAFLTAGSGLYYGGFSSKELKEALGEARRTGQWTAFYEKWREEMPLAVVCFKTGGLLTRWGQVEGAAPTQGNLFYGFENWKIS